MQFWKWSKVQFQSYFYGCVSVQILWPLGFLEVKSRVAKVPSRIQTSLFVAEFVNCDRGVLHRDLTARLLRLRSDEPLFLMLSCEKAESLMYTYVVTTANHAERLLMSGHTKSDLITCK